MVTRLQKLAVFIVLTITVAGLSSNVFSWSIFDLFAGKNFSPEGSQRIVNFDPDRDILYLPPLGDKDIFEAMDDLSICRRQDVRFFMYRYLTSGREYTVRAIERSLIYGDIVQEVFRRHPEVPRDLWLLPLLESAYDPFAVSRSRAMGLWQFVSNTSRPLGLASNRWIEERRDIEKSTEAAIRHLKGLYNTFGSWDLALAAYNGGAGHVQRARLRTGCNTLWELVDKKAIRRETAEYLPRFAAMALIYRHQHHFNIAGEVRTPPVPPTDNLVMPGAVPLRVIASLTGLSMETIHMFNPELKSSTTPPGMKDYTLRLPHRAAMKLEENPEILKRHTMSRMGTHRVKKGECLSRIARRYNQDAETIRRINNLDPGAGLKPGTVLYIPL